jgi:hypothetical protein
MNVVMTAFGVLMGIAGHPTIFQFAVVVDIFGGLTVCSLLPGALLRLLDSVAAGNAIREIRTNISRTTRMRT